MSRTQERAAVMLEPRQAYEYWAPSYDSTPNPLLALEERCLSTVMMSLFDKDVVDLGCGTGRWLQKLETVAPRSLTGVDSSRAMLAAAVEKCRPSTRFFCADCTRTPLPEHATDFVLASFVLSYIQDLDAFAREVARIARRGATVLISDVHPNARAYGWRRTFQAAGSLYEIATHTHTLNDVVDGMAQAGCRLEAMSEPCFGQEEAHIFRQAGRWEAFQKVESLPVIYWARFTVAER